MNVRCDRCKEEARCDDSGASPSDWRIVKVVPGPELDLCPRCVFSFDRFMGEDLAQRKLRADGLRKEGVYR